MDYSPCCSLQLVNRQTLTVATPQLSSNSRLLSSVTYTFSLTTVLINLLTTDSIVIEFPPEYGSQITSADSVAICTGVSISAVGNPGNIQAPGCSVQLNAIQLTNFLIASTGSAETFVVTITGRTNPSSTPTSGFNLATLSNAGYIL